MDGGDLIPGRSYAYREKRSPSSPLLKVKLLELLGRRGRVRVRFQTGAYPGLEEYAHSRQLIAPWTQNKALLRDEQRMAALKRHAGGSTDRVLWTAAATVLESSGESALCVRPRVTSIPADEAERLCHRAAIPARPERLHSLAFRDRHGTVHLPLDGVVTLARAFAAAEPAGVYRYIEAQEDELQARGYAPGERWWHDYLRHHAPGFALARDWAGHSQTQELNREIARLRTLLLIAADELNLTSPIRASRLSRAVNGG